MTSKKVRKIWEAYGATDPYFGVATFERFRSKTLDDETREEFFRTGEDYVDEIWADVKTHLNNNFNPKSAVDFGCGVGRILIPLAKRCESALGLDISQNMLDLTARNCGEQEVSNVQLALSDDNLSILKDRFDLVHSFIVFQHIEPSLGLRHFEKLVDHLNENGTGVIHLTYANDSSPFARFRFALYRDVPLIHKIRSAVLREKFEPLIPMYLYDLNAVFHMLQSKGCTDCYLKFTDHGLKGVVIYFRKKSQNE